MTDRPDFSEWTFSDLDSLRERFFAGTRQGADAASWLAAEHLFVEYLARHAEQASPHWDDFSMDNELRDRRNAGTIARIYRPITRAHIAFHDPASVLRRVKAERELLSEHAENWGHCAVCSEEDYDGAERAFRRSLVWPCPTVLAVARGWGWTEGGQHG